MLLVLRSQSHDSTAANLCAYIHLYYLPIPVQILYWFVPTAFICSTAFRHFILFSACPIFPCGHLSMEWFSSGARLHGAYSALLGGSRDKVDEAACTAFKCAPDWNSLCKLINKTTDGSSSVTWWSWSRWSRDTFGYSGCQVNWPLCWQAVTCLYAGAPCTLTDRHTEHQKSIHYSNYFILKLRICSLPYTRIQWNSYTLWTNLNVSRMCLRFYMWSFTSSCVYTINDVILDIYSSSMRFVARSRALNVFDARIAAFVINAPFMLYLLLLGLHNEAS